MQEELIEESEALPGVRLCKRPGCSKAAWPGKAYCSRECAPHAHLLERHEQFPRAAPATQAILEERQCDNHCGKTFHVLPTSSQHYCSHLCELLANGENPLTPSWAKAHGKTTRHEPPKPESKPEETEPMPRGKTAERPDTSALTGAQLAQELGVTPTTIYNWVKAGKIKPGRNGFDLDDVKRALEKNPTGKRGRRPPGAPAPKAAPAPKEAEVTREAVYATPLRAVPELPPSDTAALEQIRRRAFDAAVAKFKAVLLEESDRLEAVGDLRTQNQLLKDCIRAETRFQRCFDPEAA